MKIQVVVGMQMVYDAGSLISSSSVSSVLLSRPGTARGDFVYEANITYMADHPLKGSHDIFLTLSQQ